MTLATGSKLSPYEILSPLGAGGMGEVYRAKDTKLDRDAFIQVLPGWMGCDCDGVLRLERGVKEGTTPTSGRTQS